jgi:hypothetical protein
VKNSLREVGERLHEAEDRNEKVIAAALNVMWPFDTQVKEYDRRIIVNEKAFLFGPDKPWDWDLEPLDVVIRCWEPYRAARMYLRQWAVLTGDFEPWARYSQENGN